MEYYIYLLQIFGGGNPKIHEVIRACGRRYVADTVQQTGQCKTSNA